VVCLIRFRYQNGFLFAFIANDGRRNPPGNGNRKLRFYSIGMGLGVFGKGWVKDRFDPGSEIVTKV